MRATRSGPGMRIRRPDGRVTAIAVVLHGGKARSRRRPQPWHLAVARMVPFSRRLEAAGSRHGLAVVSILYRFRGWNGADASPVADVRDVLTRLRAEFGDVPIVLVGHSMGGRTAIRCADDPSVVGVVALAPWIEGGESVEQFAGKRLFVVHGDRDRWTDPRASAAYVERAARYASEAGRVELRGEGHGMLGRAGLWHELVVGFVLRTLGFGWRTDSTPDANATQEALDRIADGQVLLSL
jgi:pimeloyl-ACP methyl ester carboxylesterase